MTIQLNADNNLNIHEVFRDKLTDMLAEEFDRYVEHISRLEVHLSDENGNKSGTDDKRCMIEARLDGRSPIAVVGHSDTHENSLIAAIEKLHSSLDTVFGKMRNH
jgi:ribosomal subunit interface protein